MSVTDYQVLEAVDAASMLAQGITAIAAGYQPFGVPFERNSATYPYNSLLCQAFTKGLPALLLTTGPKWVDVTVTAAILDGAGSVEVMHASGYKVRDVKLIGGGTNFGAAGDRLIGLTDGTTTYTTIANADIEAIPSVTLPLGNAKVPFLTGTIATATAGPLVFKYSGGTTDHVTGSIKFSVCVESI